MSYVMPGGHKDEPLYGVFPSGNSAACCRFTGPSPRTAPQPPQERHSGSYLARIDFGTAGLTSPKPHADQSRCELKLDSVCILRPATLALQRGAFPAAVNHCHTLFAAEANGYSDG